MQQRTLITTGVIAGVVVLVGLGIAVTAANAPTAEPISAPASSTSPSAPAEPSDDAAAPSPSPTDSAAYDTAAALTYLVEEEKLAHDVYVTLGALWGSNVFANIADSETTHQDLVAPLLAARAIPDPRSAEVGVFTDPDLQALYDDLVARGSASVDEAIQVGIVIEEKDITDLNAAIAAEDEPDVISVLERLSAGSENHLGSFQRLA